MQPKQKSNSTDNTAHIQGVNASSSGLLKVTVGAAAVAGAILTFIWLPAEHGIDPTGVGHLLGLTEMGHIKEHLHEEADADAAKAKAAVNQPTSDPDLTHRLDAMQSQLDAIAIAVGAESTGSEQQTLASTTAATAAEPQVSWQHENNYTLEPDESIEVKLLMEADAIAEFEWTANGDVVNHDTHGDSDDGDKSISYKKGRSVSEQAGQLVAAFKGNHGWYWRNRTENDVVITLRTKGDYKEILLP